MGHSIQFYTFDVNENKNKITGIANEDAIYESDSRSGLSSEIRFIENNIYEDKEKAHEAIEKLDKGWYDQLAVKFYEYAKVKDTKKILNLEDNIAKKNQELNEYRNKNAIKNRKSKLVSCPKCESKINKNYVSDLSHNWNNCPLCSENLSSETVKKSIANKILKIDEMSNNLVSLKKENNKKGKKTVKWLVKTEYHI